VNTFVFDLDNTLYPEHQFLFPKILASLQGHLATNTVLIREAFINSYFASGSGENWLSIFCSYFELDFDSFLKHFRTILAKRDIILDCHFPPPVYTKLVEIIDEGKFGGVITNGNKEHQIQKVNSLNRWLDLTGQIIYADELEPKPHPRTILELVAQNGLDLNSTYYIGDSESDLEFSVNAGMNFIYSNDFFDTNVKEYGFKF
jgi:FMN phosphatase YigB (HAD superfamily)